MIFNQYFLSISTILLFALFIIIYLFRKIRQRFPKSEFCWFCHKTNQISYNEQNSWLCSHCQQYNGFSEDGNYNKVISSQFEAKHITQYCRQMPNCYANSSQLCEECNVNQEIKIKLLSEFIPFNEMNFTQECDEYKKHLEEEYRLCSDCEQKVESVLSKPINCLKDFIRNTTHIMSKPNDSIFVEQKKRANNWFLFVFINVFENISLFCALILFIFGLNEFQDTTQLSLIEMNETLTQLLSTYFSNQTLLIGIGFLNSLVVLLMSSKEFMRITNWFSQLFWTAFIFVSYSSHIRNHYLDKSDVILLRPMLALFLTILSTTNTLIHFFSFKSNLKQISNPNQKKKLFESKTNKSNVCSNKKIAKDLNEDSISGNPIKSVDQSIRKQIKALCIDDESGPKLNPRHQLMSDDRSYRSYSINQSFICDNNYAKTLILPAKFNYESIAQTSWVSAFKPNPSQSRSPRKERLNSPMFANSPQLMSSSHWINHQMSGLVTPPPSLTASIGESVFVNRYPLVNTTMKCSSPPMVDYQRNYFYNSYDSVLRNRFIGHNYKTESIGKNSEESYITGSLPSLTSDKTSNKWTKEREEKPNISVNLTQTLVFAVFLLLLFCFVIFLSLPVVFKSSCDFNSMNFHFTVESVPQNNFCIK